MRINSVSNFTKKSPNFKAILTKNVERGFNNLGYKIKEEYGEESETYENYQRDMKTLREKCPEITVDYEFYTTPTSYDELGLWPFTFSVSSKEYGKAYLKTLIRERDEDSLYSSRNLKYLAGVLKHI